VGVEPEASPTLTMALKAGEPVDAEAAGVAADSLAPRRVGKLVFPIVQSHVERVVLVPDDAISRAQHPEKPALFRAVIPNHCPRATARIYHVLDARSELPPRHRVQTRLWVCTVPAFSVQQPQIEAAESAGTQFHRSLSSLASRAAALSWNIYSRRVKFVLKLRVKAATFSVN
jgi:hypothetical protein